MMSPVSWASSYDSSRKATNTGRMRIWGRLVYIGETPKPRQDHCGS